MVSSELGSLTWSDHTPLSLDLSLSKAFPETCHCRLNESLLNQLDSKEKLSQALTEFFQLNTGSVEGRPP